jgi:hypothetical protein
MSQPVDCKQKWVTHLNKHRAFCTGWLASVLFLLEDSSKQLIQHVLWFIMFDTDRNRLALALLLLLQVADLTFTSVGIYSYGTEVEGHPLFQFLFRYVHWFIVLLTFKILISAAAIYLFSTGRHGAIRVGVIFYGLAVVAPWVYGLAGYR